MKKKSKKQIRRKQLYKVKEISVKFWDDSTARTQQSSFGMVVQPRLRTDPHRIFDDVEEILHQRENLAKANMIEKQYSYIRFRPKNGKKYPSVTSILDWDKIWRISEDELNQYAARGKIIDKLLQVYFETGKWANPLKISELKEDISVLLGGSLNFTWQSCSHEKFIKHYRRKFNIAKMKTIIFNDEHLYSGEIDAVGEYEGKRAIIDFKTGEYDMRQLAAYAVCESDIEVLVIFPVGPTDNISGYMRPVVCDTIQEKFNEFLKARAKFRERFGI